MTKSVIALLLLAATGPSVNLYHEITAPVYTTQMHIVYEGKSWSQLENEEQVAMVKTKDIPGLHNAGQEYIVTWTTHNTATPKDDTVLKVEEVQ